MPYWYCSAMPVFAVPHQYFRCHTGICGTIPLFAVPYRYLWCHTGICGAIPVFVMTYRLCFHGWSIRETQEMVVGLWNDILTLDHPKGRTQECQPLGCLDMSDMWGGTQAEGWRRWVLGSKELVRPRTAPISLNCDS